MSDEITPEERRLIDEAIAAGRTSKVDRGTGAIDYSKTMTQEQSRRLFNPWRGPSKAIQMRRKRVEAFVRQGMTAQEIADAIEEPLHNVRADLRAIGAKAAAAPRPSTPRSAPAPQLVSKKATDREARIAQRREAVRKMVETNGSTADVAREFDCSEVTIYADMRAMGLKREATRKPKPKKVDGLDAVNSKRKLAADRKLQKLEDRRRVTIATVPGGKPKSAPEGTSSTIFPDRVERPTAVSTILKDGRHNTKIGGDVLKGHLKGARIFTLTLEERATCPTTCDMWRTCYGNSLPHSTRWIQGPELEERIRTEVAQLTAMHDLVLIRLHVLGDFYSAAYVALWGELIEKHPNLHVFGFTAWSSETEIGRAVAVARLLYGRRFMVSTSGHVGPMGSFVIPDELHVPPGLYRIADAIICPEQAHALAGRLDRHCGACALCWHDECCIAFIPH